MHDSSCVTCVTGRVSQTHVIKKLLETSVAEYPVPCLYLTNYCLMYTHKNIYGKFESMLDLGPAEYGVFIQTGAKYPW